MEKNKQPILFEESGVKKKNLTKKASTLIKKLGGRRGFLLSSLILACPKYKDLM